MIEILNDIQYLIITDIGSTTTKGLLLKKNIHHQFEKIIILNTPTTVEKPFEDVKIGIYNVIKRLETETKISLLAESASLNNIIFKDKVGFLTTSSAGGGLQIIVAGLTSEDSAASGERTALGAGGVILDTISINEHRTSIEQMQAIKNLHPDIILFVGGTDGGNIFSLLRVGEILKTANPKPKFTSSNKIPLIFAGNSEAAPLMTLLLKDKYELFIEKNIRPTMKDENPKPTRDKIHEIFMNNVMEQAPGYAEVKNIVMDKIIPTPLGVLNSLSLISEKFEKKIMSVDIGGATTDFFSNILGKYYRTVSANYGMSYSISNVLADATINNVKSWLPDDLSEDYIRNYISNKMLYPSFNPSSDIHIAIEHAIAREAFRLSKEQHLKMNFNTHRIGFLDKFKDSRKNKFKEKLYYNELYENEKFSLEDFDIFIGSGGVVSHTKSPLQALHLIASGMKATGITKIWRDKDFTTPHFGKLSDIDKKEAQRLIENDCIEELGIHIRPLFTKFKPNKKALTVKINGEIKELKTGKIHYIENNEEKEIEILVHRGFSLGNADNISFKTSIPLLFDLTENMANFEIFNKSLSIYKDLNTIDLNEVFASHLHNTTVEDGEFIIEYTLPYEGEIHVQKNEIVNPETILGQINYEIPKIYILTLFDKVGMNLSKENLDKHLMIKENDILELGQVIAKSSKPGFLGSQNHYTSPIRGRVEKINFELGTIIVREIQDYSHKPVKINVAKRLNIKPKYIQSHLKRNLGDFIFSGQILAQKHIKNSVPIIIYSPSTGWIREINKETGDVTIIYDKKPYKMKSGVKGKVLEIIENQSVKVEVSGTKLSGVIGFGKENYGKIKIFDNNEGDFTEGDIAVFYNKVTLENIKKLSKQKIRGIITSSIENSDLINFIGKEIGVALTGDENIPFPLIVLNGFGDIPITKKMRDFFVSKEGKSAYLKAHTQIRAGVVRPKIYFY